MIRLYSFLVRLGKWADRQRYPHLLEYVKDHRDEPASAIGKRFGVSRQEVTAIKEVYRKMEIKPPESDGIRLVAVNNEYAPWQKPLEEGK